MPLIVQDFSSAPSISAVCVDLGSSIDFSSQSFTSGLFLPIFFFFIGMGISAIYSVIRSL